MKPIDSFRILKKEGAVLFEDAPLSKIYFLSCLVFWLSLLKFHTETLPGMSWQSWPLLLPSLMALASLGALGGQKKIIIPTHPSGVILQRKFFWIPLQRKALAPEDFKQILLRNKRNKWGWRLYLEKKRGGKILLGETGDREKIKCGLKWLQSLLSLPLAKA